MFRKLLTFVMLIIITIGVLIGIYFSFSIDTTRE